MFCGLVYTFLTHNGMEWSRSFKPYETICYRRNVGSSVRAVATVNNLNKIDRHNIFPQFTTISDLEKPVDARSKTNVVLIKTSPSGS